MTSHDLPSGDGPRTGRPKRRTFTAAYKLRMVEEYDAAETFCHHFFDYYNHRHYHAGIGLHTPFTMHIGTAQAIQHKRAATIAAFRTANPQRFTQTPTLPKIPTVAQINRPDEDTTDQTSTDQEEHAA